MAIARARRARKFIKDFFRSERALLLIHQANHGLLIASYVSNVTIADDTGSIRLSVWKNRGDKLHAGDEVELTNCYVARFAGQP
jgi:hypothetical protein